FLPDIFEGYRRTENMPLFPIEHPRTQSSLLVPGRFLQDFRERTDRGRREIYFHYLIKRYSYLIMSGALGSRKTVKKRFQDPGKDLVKKNFRPFNPDWIEFDNLSDYLGLSKTGLFTLLLMLDIAGWGALLAEKFYDRGVPPTISEFSSRVVMLRRIPVQVYRKIYYKIRR
ncbi:MAG: DUF1564 domain-containing protein, partial [Leptospira sp.]|nr:DUF1564 domain-containing protein [Leptospira sp.]